MLKVGFTGDVSYTGFFRHSLGKGGVFSREIGQFLSANDHNVFNIEGPLFDAPEGISGLASPPAALASLVDLGCSVFNLANNHIMDFGELGLRETLSLAVGSRIFCFGAGENLSTAATPVILDKDDVRVGLVAVTHQEGQRATAASSGTFCHNDATLLVQQLRNLKKTCDWVVVNYHGGEEFTHLPMPARRRRLRRYLELGADIVVAHHPHVIQGFERLGDKSIFYSLGNFIFDIPPHYSRSGTTDSVLLRITFHKETYEVETLFTRIDRLQRRIGTFSESPFFREIDARKYHRAWCEDAFRAIRAARAAQQYRSVTPRKNRSFKLFGLVRSGVRILGAPNLRPLVLGAGEYLVKKRLGFWHGGN